MDATLATPFVLLLDPEATCSELGERLKEVVESLQLPVEAIQKECKAWFGQIARIRAEVKANEKEDRRRSSYSPSFYNGYGTISSYEYGGSSSSNHYNNGGHSRWGDDEDDVYGATSSANRNNSMNHASSSSWNRGSNPNNTWFGTSYTNSSESSLNSNHSSLSHVGAVRSELAKPSSGGYGVVKPRGDRPTSALQSTSKSIMNQTLSMYDESENSSDGGVYFDEKEGVLAESSKKHTDALRKALVKPSDPQAKDSSQSSTSSTSSTSSSNWPFGLPGGNPDAALDSEAPQNEAVSGAPTEETPSKGVKMEKSESQEIAQSPAKDPKIASNSMEAEKKPVLEGGLRDVPTKKSVPLRAIEERSAGQKSEIPTVGAIIPIQTPITPKDEFDIQVNSSDESVYSESDVHPMDLEGYQPNGQPASNSIEDPALQADEADLEWEKSAPFLPLYHSYSSRSTIEPKNFFLCNDRNAKVRSLVRTYTSTVTTIELVVKCIISEKMKQKVTSYQYYDYSYEHGDALNHDPLWSRLFKPLTSAKLYDFDKEKAALNPENSLRACLNRFSTRGNLDNENKWFCPRCQNEVCAENRTLIDRLPDVLILQLERFEYDQSAVSYSYYSNYSSYGARRKINTTIGFPITGLEMKPWLHDASREQGEDCVYDLVSICNHSGTSSGGHYYCYAKDENDGEPRWKEYNDSSVMDIDETMLVRSTAYVLFYQRRRAALRSDELCKEIEKKVKEEEEARKKEEEERRRKWEEERREWMKRDEEERRRRMEREEEEEEGKEKEKKKWVEEPPQVDSWPYAKVGSEEENGEKGSKSEDEATTGKGVYVGMPVISMDNETESEETEAKRSDPVIQVTIGDKEENKEEENKEEENKEEENKEEENKEETMEEEEGQGSKPSSQSSMELES